MEKWFEGRLTRRILSLALSVVMVMSLLPMPSIAAEDDGLCDHHTAHENCGYVAAVAGQECGHVCGEDCYTVTTDCHHVHDESCYSDGVLPAAGEEKEPDKCTHACSEESGCVTKAHTCVHTDHDDSCGYKEAVAGSPCTFVCEECAAAQRIQAFLDAVAALNPDSPDADALLDAACEALDALEDEDRELPEVQEAMATLDEALGIIPEEAALYIDVVPTVPQVYPSATMIKLKAVGFPSTTKAKVQKDQKKFLNFDIDSVSATEICLIVQYMGDASGTITLPKASDLWEYDTPNELLGVSWSQAVGGPSWKKEGDQVSYAYGPNVAEYDFKGTTVTYNLVYDLDGGEGNIPSASKTTDERECKFDVTTQTPTRAGYKFLGWAETRNAYTPSTKTSYTVKRSEGTTKTLYAVWKALYTVTYTDGVDEVTLFEDQSHTVESGSDTPAFQGKPTRSGYVFDCWKSSDYLGGWIDWQNKVYNDVTYVAFWKEDRNNNGVADESETRYTITYQDGANGQYFNTQTFTDQLSGLKTPAFTNPVNRPGYVISGWSPSLSTTIAGNTTYTAIWSKDDNNNGVPDERDPKYTVTYVDGLNGFIFQPETHSDILSGLSTPEFTQKETVSRPGYVLYGWNNWKSTVTENVTYTARWEPDINGNNKADKDEPKYTVTYKDGVNGAAFQQQQYTNQLVNMPTPAFTGKTERSGYVFDGWNPKVEETISGTVTYTAKWEVDENGNGVADRDDPKYTILYTDGVKNVELFRDQATLNCLPGIPTPAFNGTPTRKGYVFGGWSPEVEATVTDTTIYTAVWKLDANENGTADEEEIIILSLPDKTYDGRSVSMDGKYQVLDDGAVTVAYKPKDAEDTAYTADAPKNAGTYTVRLTKTLGDDSVSVTEEFTIQPKAVTVSGITAENKTYDGTTNATLNYNGVVFTGKLDGDNLSVTATGTFADANVDENKTVNITALTLGGASEYNYVLAQAGQQTQTEATIFKANASVTDKPKDAQSLYDGSPVSLVIAGTTGDGTMMYRLGEDGEWTNQIPTATDCGTYTVYYMVEGDGNHTNTEAQPVEAEIVPFKIQRQTEIVEIGYSNDAVMSVTLDTILDDQISYQWYQVTDEGDVALTGETAKELTIHKPNAGKYTYVCKITCGEYTQPSEEVTVTVNAGKITVDTDTDEGLLDYWLEGGEAPAADGQTEVPERSPSSRLLTQYTTEPNDQGDQYPSGMKVFVLNESKQPVEIPELGNLLNYEGCSIRIVGQPGIRMITSLTKEAKTALTQANLAGFTLEEYGTAIQWADILNNKGQTLTLSTGEDNYAYRKGVSDPVFANVGNMTQYTNVLIWDSLTDEQYAAKIAMRPYIILSSENGETVTLYGGTVERSIYDVAKQNADTFPVGSAGYNYVHDIIDRVDKPNSSTNSSTGGNVE